MRDGCRYFASGSRYCVSGSRFFDSLRADVGRLGPELGPLRVNFRLEGKSLATEIEYRPLEVDYGPLGVDFLTLSERMLGVWKPKWYHLVNFSLDRRT